ncbi:MAG: ATP-binding cassette domain-containing protein [Planctomycetota bacterium]|nr:ATP-binding cassette domain-containing protein [Planctomycetota bacterium]MDI6787511.1 ATP-binding cassette domain-containing protein [Planctomycetota bacterium]
MTNIVLKTENLCRHFGKFVAVHDLSLEIYSGDIYGFIGLNGAGKTTTIRMLLHLLKPDSGKIYFYGKDLNKYRIEIMRYIGGLVEIPAFYPYLSGWDNLALFAHLRGTTKPFICSAVQNLLESVGLKGRSKDKVSTYSMGMRQRLGIAIALLPAFLLRRDGTNSPFIILDEPTNGLDPQGIADIRNLIKKLNKEQNVTFLISSHLLSEMELLCNRVGIIRTGKLIISDDLQKLLKEEGVEITQPRRPLEKYFMGLV